MTDKCARCGSILHQHPLKPTTKRWWCRDVRELLAALPDSIGFGIVFTSAFFFLGGIVYIDFLIAGVFGWWVLLPAFFEMILAIAALIEIID